MPETHNYVIFDEWRLSDVFTPLNHIFKYFKNRSNYLVPILWGSTSMAIEKSLDRRFCGLAFLVRPLNVFLQRIADLTDLGIGEMFDPDELIARCIERAEYFV